MACNFLRRFLLKCFGGEPESLETSIQGSGGNIFSKYYWQRRLARHLYGQISTAVVQANLQIEDHNQLVSEDDTESSELLIQGSSGNTFSQSQMISEGDTESSELSIQGSSENTFSQSQLVSEGNTESSELSIQGSSGNTFSQLELSCHLYGMFSMAGVGPPANFPNKDRSQLVSGTLTEREDGPRGVFVGIYDGHGGTTCSQFLLDHLFPNLKSAIANQNGVINEKVFQETYQRTELAFVNHVRSNWQNEPQLAVLGSCCLVGVVFNKVLHVANAGDSRAVLARWPDGGDLEVIQLSVDYNAKYRERRDEVSEEHPPGTSLFEEFEGCPCVRGSLPVTRAIGHVYLKYDEFNQAPLPVNYIQKEPIVRPILKAEPTIRSRYLGPDDRFVIFASDGLWDEISNEDAATLVKNNPRDGAAGMLLKEALRKAAARHEMEYLDLRSFLPSDKRCYHDDISIVILFFDNLQAPAPAPSLFFLERFGPGDESFSC